MMSVPVRRSLAALVWLLAPAAWAGAQYTVTDLGTLGGDQSQAAAVNPYGVVVGHSRTGGADDHDRAFLWDGTTMTDLGGLVADGDSFATGVNRKSHASGYATAPDGSSHAVLFANGTVTDLHARRDDFLDSEALGINARGWIVGTALMTDGLYHGWVFARDHFKVLEGGSHALGLNDRGQAVGTYKTKGMLFDHGTDVAIGTLGGSWSEADAINDSGVVTGWAATRKDRQAHAFAWLDGDMTDLGTLGGLQSQGLAINADGTVVGWSYTSGTKARHAFIVKAGGAMRDLNDLIDKSLRRDWLLVVATGIDRAGEICGTGTHDGQVHAFRLTPIP